MSNIFNIDGRVRATVVFSEIFRSDEPEVGNSCIVAIGTYKLAKRSESDLEVLNIRLTKVCIAFEGKNSV